MPGTVTLSTLRTLVRQRADMENSTFVTDSEVSSYVNASAAELHNLLADTFEEYSLVIPPTTFVMSAGVGNNFYTLPADFFRIRRLQFQDNTSPSGWRKVPRFNLEDMERVSSAMRRAYAMSPYRAYRIMGDGTLWLLPEDDASGTYRLWYGRAYQAMVLDTDTINDWETWSEYVVIDAAIKCLQKEESDVSILMARKAEIKDRLERAAHDRDAGSAHHVTDVVRDTVDPWWTLWP